MLAIVSLCIFGKEKEEKEYIWLPVIGFKIKDIKVYYDKSSIIEETTEHGDVYNSGMLLMVVDKSFKIKGVDGPGLASSMITYMIIDCKSGMFTPIYDLVYSTKLPSRKDKPLGTREHDPESDVSSLEKSSPLYHVLCPVYI